MRPPVIAGVLLLAFFVGLLAATDPAVFIDLTRSISP
jgi:hypothetical protein